MITPPDVRLKGIFPKCKTLADGRVVLPHRPQEVRILWNLGYKVPSPILSSYDWRDTTPFEAQRVTSAMLVCEPRAFVLNTMGCVDSETEYLSPTGWVKIADYQGGKVAQYHPDTRQLEFVEPQEFVKQPCSDMVRIKTTRGLDQLLSPEHRVLLECRTGGRKVVHAGDLIGAESQYRNWGVPVTFRAPDNRGVMLTDDEIRVMVAVKADGNVREDCRKVYVRLKRQRKKERLRALLTAAGISFDEVSRDYEYAKGFTVFSFIPPERSKGFEGWWVASQHQLEVITDEVTHWDGSFRRAGGAAWSSRTKSDADFVQYAFAACGRTASLMEVHRDTGTDYVVHSRKTGNPVSFYGIGDDRKVKRNVWPEPSTDGFKYCFMVPSTFLVFRRNGKVFVSGNTGKTRSVLFAYDYLRKAGLVRKMLVVAPLSTLTFTWAREVFHVMPEYKVAVLHGTKARRLRILKETDADIFVINHDGLGVIKDELIHLPKLDVICFDEVAAFRNYRTQKWKNAKAISLDKPYVWGLTGTPTPNAPTDAYGIIKLINPSAYNGSFKKFRDMLMQNVTTFKWVPRRGSEKRVFEIMQPSVRYRLEDCVDIPPTQYVQEQANMGRRQKAAYDALRQHSRVLVDQNKITAANQGVLLNKMLQISTGCVYDSNKVPVVLDSGPRLQLVQRLVEEADEKTIVFCPFVPIVDMVYEHLKKAGITTYKIYGATPQAMRNDIFQRFQGSRRVFGPEAIVAHPATMSHGLTLTMANTIIWYGPISDLEVYEQANARIARPGQEASRVIVKHIVAAKIDELVYKKLMSKAKTQDALLELYNE